MTIPRIFAEATAQIASGAKRPFDFVVVDEAQDVGVPQLRFLATLAGDRPNGLFFAGDLGQRIFQTPFSWRSLGVDVWERSQTRRMNYRTSHQIRRQTDLLLPPAMSDVDGNSEARRGTVSAFNGSQPQIEVLESPEAEQTVVAAWLRARHAEGLPPHEMGVFVRSMAEMDRAITAVRAAGLPSVTLDPQSAAAGDAVAVGTMHLAKGLEYRAVVVTACNDEVLPLQTRIESIADEEDLEEVYETERHLLYVACTQARDHLLVTGVAPASEFLDDLQQTRSSVAGEIASPRGIVSRSAWFTPCSLRCCRAAASRPNRWRRCARRISKRRPLCADGRDRSRSRGWRPCSSRRSG